ncbi:hypothetical protein SO802_005353 [Lithocarpus litseifolius]|uniref:DUF4283 domain-containing protein n=1 Tax=Lithocarpus litseifolius TaxID=425828 RepID=A0AAW2DHX5_9ROSI
MYGSNPNTFKKKEGLQHLRLTKEEEEDIAILTISRSDLTEECALSLFGKLLSDRQQNQRALKSTLRAAWKMGSKLRIVDVGKDILQFKFTSGYRMEWVKRNGPWNFDNNLLLWCHGKKNLSEEVGRDLGNSLGQYIETDKRSWCLEQAKFMRIRVELPLRRGGNIIVEGKILMFPNKA